MLRLAELAQGRDNNFNLIRMVAAFLVLFTHSFALVAGSSSAEPDLYNTMTFGTLAVHIFFVISGFLVTASMLSRQSLGAFIQARVLRIYPALIVVILLTVFGLGVYMTTLSLSDYFIHIRTYSYLLRGLTVFSGVAYVLPGVFENVPSATLVNGSLWTLPYEVRAYALIAVGWAIFMLAPLHLRKRYFAAFIVVAFVFFTGIAINDILTQQSLNPKSCLFSMFFAGAVYYLLREKILLSLPIFILVVGLLALSLWLSISFHSKEVFCVAYLFAMPYLLLYIAYVPSGVIRSYNKLGDYSYGMYIYAFPVQQMLVAHIPTISTAQMILYSTAVTLCFAILSWRLIEKPALNLKNSSFRWPSRRFKPS